MRARAFAYWLLVLPLAAVAETAYVTDRVEARLLSGFVEGASPVKTVESGTALEVLERYGNQARVRDPEGAEGWIEARLLTHQPSAREQLKAMKSELERTRAQVVKLQTQVDAARAPDPAAKRLEAELAGVRAELAQAQDALKEAQTRAAEPPPAPPPPPAPASGEEAGGGFSFLWAAISFAMLLVGFVGGRVWVREAIRRRMGGMYLRI